jgi:hypothetical protein
MTTKPKAKADEEPEEEPAKVEAVPACGKVHFLPALAHVTCTEPAPDPDRPPGTPEHEHRHEDGDLIYVW